MPLSDIVCCNPEELPLAVTSEEPSSIGSWFMAKGIGSIELCQLGELLGIGTYAEINRSFKLVGEPLPEGPWPESMDEDLLSEIRSPTQESQKSRLNGPESKNSMVWRTRMTSRNISRIFGPF